MVKTEDSLSKFFMDIFEIFENDKSINWENLSNDLFEICADVNDVDELRADTLKILGKSFREFFFSFDGDSATTMCKYYETFRTVINLAQRSEKMRTVKGSRKILCEASFKVLMEIASMGENAANTSSSMYDKISRLTGQFVINQRSEFNKIKRNMESEYNTLKTKNEKYLNDMESKLQNVLPQTITVLGVFTAIIVVFFGGMSLVNLFQDMYTISPHRFFLGLIGMGHIIVNFLFLMMFMLSRLLERPVSVDCDFELISENGNTERKCKNCKNSCSQYQKLVKKYPYIIYPNILILLLETVIFSWWFLERYLWYIMVFDNPIISSLLYFVSVVLGFFSVLSSVIFLLSNGAVYDRKKNMIKSILSGLLSIVLISVFFIIGWC